MSSQSFLTVYLKYSKMKFIAGSVSLQSFWQKRNFILDDKIFCKHSRNKIIWKEASIHELFHKNKDGRSKDQSKNKFYLILPSMKTNVKRFFFHDGRKFHFWSLKESLGNPFNGCSFCLQLLKRLFCFCFMKVFAF